MSQQHKKQPDRQISHTINNKKAQISRGTPQNGPSFNKMAPIHLGLW